MTVFTAEINLAVWTLDDGSPAAAGPLIIPYENLFKHDYLMDATQFNTFKNIITK